MTGDKPDPRLRTPMQWAPGRGMGFTTGTAWEPAQADSMTRTVAAETGDPNSLLNLYRRLIHLRSANDALASGRLVPLSASSPHVAAYLRRTSHSAVLVVANLSGAPIVGATLSADAGTLPAGRYAPRNLLGGPGGAPLEARANGVVAGYRPVATLGAHETLVFNLDRQPVGH